MIEFMLDMANIDAVNRLIDTCPVAGIRGTIRLILFLALKENIKLFAFSPPEPLVFNIAKISHSLTGVYD
jgi:hypothetical protein